jgi:hypothetical protein
MSDFAYAQKLRKPSHEDDKDEREDVHPVDTMMMPTLATTTTYVAKTMTSDIQSMQMNRHW